MIILIRILADAFVISFLYTYRYDTILRFYNVQNLLREGTKQSAERWNRCLTSLQNDFGVALLVMYERRRTSFDRVAGDFNRNVNSKINIYESAEGFLRKAVEKVKEQFLVDNYLRLSESSDVLMKLKNVTIILGLTNKTLPLDKLENFYSGLKLNGSEEFLESMIQLSLHKRKIFLEPHGSWRKKIDNLSEKFHITYNIEDGNYLCKL